MNQLLDNISIVYERLNRIRLLLEDETPKINASNISNQTYIYENIQIVNNNSFLRKNNKMIGLKPTGVKKKSQVNNIEFNTRDINKNSIDIAFREANKGKNVYLLVFGDFRYVGGGVYL